MKRLRLTLYDLNLFRDSRNLHEEALFRCEDSQYEVDLVLDSMKSTLRAMDTLLLKSGGAALPPGFKLGKNSLSVIHLKSISRMYGSRGHEVLKVLRESPGNMIPVILERLRSSIPIWEEKKLALAEGWRDIMYKNYYKSLDHQR